MALADELNELIKILQETQGAGLELTPETASIPSEVTILSQTGEEIETEELTQEEMV